MQRRVPHAIRLDISRAEEREGFLAVAAMTRIPLGAYTAPPLTPVALRLPELSRTMVDRIMLRLKAPATPPAEFRFASSLLALASISLCVSS